ncbi:hypothetical protein PHET_11793 [Paragonimus heterotremus]|uniref:Uncharacterized protein n=1 Tax=Paragonimus heterotremus TaxID=100268 RepID=A0A8J4T0P2_9TREM|nr:hypothetical protein PHET_11793 [Paragonimus heterotremus]
MLNKRRHPVPSGQSISTTGRTSANSTLTQSVGFPGPRWSTNDANGFFNPNRNANQHRLINPRLNPVPHLVPIPLYGPTAQNSSVPSTFRKLIFLLTQSSSYSSVCDSRVD